MFCDYDSNKSGSIDIFEVQKILFSMGMTNFETKAKELMDIVDVDGSGEIDFDEVCTNSVSKSVSAHWYALVL